MWSSVVMIALRASTHVPGSPACTSAAATSRLLSSSPTAATTSDMLGDSSRSSSSVRTTAASCVALLVDLRFERRVAGRELARGHQVTLPELRHAGHRVVGLRGRRVGGDFEQRVGDAAHGRHHHGGPGTVTAARSTNDLDEAADGFRVGHRRAAELLYDHGSEAGLKTRNSCTKTPPTWGQNDVYSTRDGFLPSCNFCRAPL